MIVDDYCSSLIFSLCILLQLSLSILTYASNISSYFLFKMLTLNEKSRVPRGFVKIQIEIQGK